MCDCAIHFLLCSGASVLLGWLYGNAACVCEVERLTGQPQCGAAGLSLSQAEVLACLRQCLEQQQAATNTAQQVRARLCPLCVYSVLWQPA
jgi:hypothetical protein